LKIQARFVILEASDKGLEKEPETKGKNDAFRFDFHGVFGGVCAGSLFSKRSSRRTRLSFALRAGSTLFGGGRGFMRGHVPALGRGNGPLFLRAAVSSSSGLRRSKP